MVFVDLSCVIVGYTVMASNHVNKVVTTVVHQHTLMKFSSVLKIKIAVVLAL